MSKLDPAGAESNSWAVAFANKNEKWLEEKAVHYISISNFMVLY